jgi:hypothetical protein
MKLHEVDLVTGVGSETLAEAPKVPDLDGMRKKADKKKDQIEKSHKKAEKVFARSAAQFLVAQEWDLGIEGLIEVFQEIGPGKELNNSIKNFDKDMQERAMGLFRDDPDIFDDIMAEIHRIIQEEARKVKL